MFEILIKDEGLPVSDSSGERVAVGEITIGDFRETFVSGLSLWAREQYELHWLKALERLAGGADRSALITDYVEPAAHVISESYLVWWPLYRETDTILVQNQLLFFHQWSQPFSAACFWESVQNRRTVNEEGQKISEWGTTVQEIRAFLDSVKGRISPAPQAG